MNSLLEVVFFHSKWGRRIISSSDQKNLLEFCSDAFTCKQSFSLLMQTKDIPYSIIHPCPRQSICTFHNKLTRCSSGSWIVRLPASAISVIPLMWHRKLFDFEAFILLQIIVLSVNMGLILQNFKVRDEVELNVVELVAKRSQCYIHWKPKKDHSCPACTDVR